jgi:hypothetical protein
MGSPRVSRVNAYLRDKGVVCYEFPLFFAREKGGFQAQVASELIASALDWHWTSEQTSPVSERSPVRGLPPIRPLAQLSTSNQGELARDFGERNVDGYGRHIVLIGGDAGLENVVYDESRLREALHIFATEEAGPIRMIIFQENDGNKNEVYVPHTPVAPVAALIRGWGVNPTEISWWHKLKYKRLGVIQLELLLDGIVKTAGGTR